MKKKVLAIALAACMVVGLVPVAMTNANVNANEKQETTSELDVQTEPEMVPIKVIFRDGQGTKVGDARVIVSEDTTKVPATSLVAPKGYKIVSVGNISGRGTLFVQVEKIEEEKEPEMVAVNVIYTEKGEKIGESRTVIWDNVTEVPATSLVAPEGYKIVLVGNIDWESQTLNVEVEKIVSEELPTEKGFRIYYVTESGREISHHTVKAQITRVGELEVITVEADQLRVPEGYELVETPDLTFTNGEKETKLVVKAIIPLTPLEPSTPVEPEDKPVDPEVKPVDPEVKPVDPEVKPGDSEVKPGDSEVKPGKTDKADDKKPAEENKKESKTPKTGDESHVGVWFSVVALSGAAVVVFARRRKNS